MDSQDVLDSESSPPPTPIPPSTTHAPSIFDWTTLSTALAAVGLVVALFADIDLMLFGIVDRSAMQWHIARWTIACICIIAAVPITHGLAGKNVHQR